MVGPDSTSWTLIRGAARGDQAAREEFVRRYEPVVRAFLAARWKGGAFLGEIDDAAQEVMLVCLSRGSPLGRAEEEKPGGFRAYLWGVVRNVARSMERDRRKRATREPVDVEDLPADEASLASVFDRAWARSLLAQAAALQRERARVAGEAAVRRIELLRLRMDDDLPIREIATLWHEAPEHLHREYARAREEYKRCLVDVVRHHHDGDAVALEEECRRLVALFA